MRYDYGLWWLVAVHVAWLAVFVVAFLRPTQRREWRSLGVPSGGSGPAKANEKLTDGGVRWERQR